MSKMKQIAALTAILVGVVLYASPAKSAVCFLPDDDGSCGGGDIEISDNPTPENQCTDFKLSKNQRDSKEYSSDCYTCESCTFNNRTTYRCSPKSGATWYGNLGVCCTNGETYDSAEGQCCPAGGCTHDCKAPKEWNSVERKCKCPNGKDADGDICCADSEYVSNGICCATDKENVNGVCVCKQGTIPDGTGCKPDDSSSNCVYGDEYYLSYDEEEYQRSMIDEGDINCYSCCKNPNDTITPYYCKEDIKDGYQLQGGCTKCTLTEADLKDYDPNCYSCSPCGNTKTYTCKRDYSKGYTLSGGKCVLEGTCEAKGYFLKGEGDCSAEGYEEIIVRGSDNRDKQGRQCYKCGRKCSLIYANTSEDKWNSDNWVIPKPEYPYVKAEKWDYEAYCVGHNDDDRPCFDYDYTNRSDGSSILRQSVGSYTYKDTKTGKFIRKTDLLRVPYDDAVRPSKCGEVEDENLDYLTECSPVGDRSHIQEIRALKFVCKRFWPQNDDGEADRSDDTRALHVLFVNGHYSTIEGIHDSSTQTYGITYEDSLIICTGGCWGEVTCQIKSQYFGDDSVAEHKRYKGEISPYVEHEDDGEVYWYNKYMSYTINYGNPRDTNLPPADCLDGKDR